MSWKICRKVWSLAPEEYAGTTFVVLLALADYAKHDGSRIFPRRRVLARKARTSEASVKRALKQLVEDEAIVLLESRGSGQSKRFRIGDRYLPDDMKTRVTMTQERDQLGSPRPDKEESDQRTTPTKDSVELDFETWWKSVPRRVAKGAAWRAYRTALQKTDAGTLLTGIKKYAVAVAGRESQYIKHPATWLNGECWEDELDGIAALTPDSPAWLHFEGCPEPEPENWRWGPYRTLDSWQKDVLRREAREARESADG